MHLFEIDLWILFIKYPVATDESVVEEHIALCYLFRITLVQRSAVNQVD